MQLMRRISASFKEANIPEMVIDTRSRMNAGTFPDNLFGRSHEFLRVQNHCTSYGVGSMPTFFEAILKGAQINSMLVILVLFVFKTRV